MCKGTQDDPAPESGSEGEKLDPGFPDLGAAEGRPLSGSRPRGSAKAGAKLYLARGANRIRGAFDAGVSGHRLIRNQALLVDRLLAAAFEEVDPDGTPWVLAGVGGYGRAELAPHSDIDLLILVPADRPAAIDQAVERLLYLLWDSGLELGHAVRTLAECTVIAEQDATARTALLDGRFVAGDRAAFEAFEVSMLGEVHSQRVEAYVRARVADWQARRARHGRTVFRLEPDLKLGRGGQRDLQTALWIARVCHHVTGITELARRDLLGPADEGSLRAARDFLWRLRCGLHYRAGRRVDLLTFDAQEDLARTLGYCDRTHQLAVEHFMRDVYLSAREVDRVARGIIERSLFVLEERRGARTPESVAPGFVRRGDRLDFVAKPATDVEHDPDLCLRALRLSETLGTPLAASARDRLRTASRVVDPGAWQAPERVSILRALAGRGGTTGGFLEVLHETGVLGKMLPEFARVSGLWQHDLYHAYTVDVHSIFAARRVLALRSGARDEPRFGPLARQIAAPFVVFLAALLHDIGKGLGGGHAEKGAARIPEIAARLGLDDEKTDDLIWLVRAHLLMSHLSQRRDLSDPDLIDGFAAEVRTRARLQALTLLTYVDASTTNEAAWTGWKAELLWQLHDQTARRLAGEGRGPELLPRARARAALGAALPDPGGRKAEVFIESLPDRYLLAVAPAAARRHFELIVRLAQGEAAAVDLHVEPGREVEALTVACTDRKGLLADLSGLLAAERRSILSARVFSLRDGRVLDLFELVPTPLERGEADRQALCAALVRAAVEPGFGEAQARMRVRRSALGHRPRPKVAVRVRVNNAVSAAHTVVDVFGPDQVGLLHAITRALHFAGAQVVLARVATEAHRATDAFYVVDEAGKKITDVKAREALESAIARAVREV